MKRSVALFLTFPILAFSQKDSFELKVKFTPFKNKYIYLGHHYGKQKPIVDSVLLDNNSTAVFRRSKPMEKGVYLIGLPDKSGYFELLIDKEQKFAVEADSSDLIRSIRFQGSPDNDIFVEYQRFSASKGSEIEAEKKKLAVAKNKADSASINARIRKLGEDLNNYRLDLIKKNPDATLTALLNAMRDPVVPPVDKHPGGKYDSLFAYNYYKSHYWDDVYFFDERLVRTSFFESKLEEYFERLVFPNPDSVIKEIDWMLGYASANDEMQKFLLIKFVNRYLNQKYMWEDRVFVHLFEKYFSQKDYPWLNEKGKKTVFDRAYSLMANLFGSQASDIEATDSSGKTKNLFSIGTPYTVLVFWDPSCGHCKETLPRIDSIYRAKWKAANVSIFAVSKESEGSRNDWVKFIRDHKLEGWTHVYYSRADETARTSKNIPGYLQLFDIQTVPTIYLLDKDKRIIAKKIPFEQVDEVLQFKMKNK